MERPFSFAPSKIAQMGDGNAAEVADNYLDRLLRGLRGTECCPQSDKH